jgi:hypothetical protein
MVMNWFVVGVYTRMGSKNNRTMNILIDLVANYNSTIDIDLTQQNLKTLYAI